MGVLQEIIREATSRDGDVPRMLRQCLLLGKRLGHTPLTTWVQYELNGYPTDVELPSYRQLRTRNCGLFENSYHRVTLEIPLAFLPDDIAENFKSANLRDGVGELAHLLAASQDGGDGRLQIPWLPEVTLLYLKDMVQGGYCRRAWSEISASELAGALDQIKSKVLGFALDIEVEAPTAGDIPGTDHLLLKEEKLQQIFNNNITGTVQNLANGSKNFSQTSSTGITAGDFAALVALLANQGLAEKEIASLRDAVEADNADGLGTKVKEWLGDLASKAATGAVTIGLDKVTAVVMPAINAYLGPA